MDQRSPTFEATLLHKTAPNLDQNQIKKEFAKTLDAHNETIENIEKIDSVYYLFHCQSVKILLAIGADPLPLDGMLNATRPGAVAIHETQILAQLVEIGASSTLLVLERDPNTASGAPEQALKMRNICWELSDRLYACTSTDLVFWSETETLYAAPEFERAATYHATQSNLPQVEAAHKHFRDAPNICGTMRTWIENDQESERQTSSPKACESDQNWFERLQSVTKKAIQTRSEPDDGARTITARIANPRVRAGFPNFINLFQ